MNQYRVTKYDPAFRDAADAFAKQDWTAISDIGRSFGGVTLRKEDYLRTESAYIETAMKFFTEDRAPAFRAVGVENRARFLGAPVEGSQVSKRARRCRRVIYRLFVDCFCGKSFGAGSRRRTVSCTSVTTITCMLE
jgi:hypothetical protein